ncbi:hypothetical protein PCANC_26628 [Puccinia coronata f. sp. avenae]|uniref:Uncharacterized protein n=1 Tax=Puccinia coronata f. sp. avenae TaxID=200324 RepID=A0A2N5TL81_9BASI|nr:hypothetical protein PCANC_26628 [Puccinia coronata f. sp. avenae]
MTTCRNAQLTDVPFVDNPKSIIRAANAAKRCAAASASRAALRARVQLGRKLNRLSRLPPLPTLPTRSPTSPSPSNPPKPLAPLMANPSTSNTAPGEPSMLAADATLQRLLEWHPPPLTGPRWSNQASDAPSRNQLVPPGPENHSAPPGPKNQSAPSSNGQTQGTQVSHEVEFMRMLLESQHHSLIQAHNNCMAAAERMARIEQATAKRIARLEDAILFPSVRPEAAPNCTNSTPPPPSDRVDLQKFCFAEGPIYSGLFQAVEPFLKWLSAVQLFSATKAVMQDTNKIRIVCGLIREINTLAFYSNSINTFVQLAWSEFKRSLLDFALPTLWRTKLRHQIHKLAMGDTETFLLYSTRAQTLQSMVNFDDHLFLDFALAEFVVSGLPNKLKAHAKNFKLLETTPFVYGVFKSKLQRYYDYLPRRATGRACQTTPATPSSTPTANRPFGVSTPSLTCKVVVITAKPPAAVHLEHAQTPPTEPTSTSQQSGKPAQAPAGRSSAVAGVAEEQLSPDLDAASVAAFAAINKELRLTKAEEYVKPPRIVILLQCGDCSLRGLVDTGSEINLISNAAVQRLPLKTHPLQPPMSISLELDKKAPKPLVLSKFVLATLADPISTLKFPDVHLKVGPIVGDYDMILGTPFLFRFDLSVSISSQSLLCNESTRAIFDYRCTQPSATVRKPNCKTPKDPNDLTKIANKVLAEFADLFPSDIPVVSLDTKSMGHSLKSAFPGKIQDAASKTCHKIVLTGPGAVINKRQYPYPQNILQPGERCLTSTSRRDIYKTQPASTRPPA